MANSTGLAAVGCSGIEKGVPCKNSLTLGQQKSTPRPIGRPTVKM